MASYGINFNAAYTMNADGKSTLGVHITDSDGLDINKEKSGDNAVKVVTDLCNDITSDLNTIKSAKVAKKEKEAAEKRRAAKAAREKKLADLKQQAADLQKQIAEIEDEAKTVKTSKPITNISSLADDFDEIMKLFSNIF